MEWVKKMKNPHYLIDKKELLHNRATAVYLLFSHRQLYSLNYFRFIDFILTSNFAPYISTFLSIASKCSEIDLKWKDALFEYTGIENSKYGKK